MKRLLYLLCQWTWGLPQTLVGAAFYLYYRRKGCPHFRYQVDKCANMAEGPAGPLVAL